MVILIQQCNHFFRAREEMLKRGVDPESPEAKLFGRKLLTALTAVFGRTILETGFFHAGTSLCSGDELLPLPCC